MNLSKNMRAPLILVAIFTSTFTTVFSGIVSAQFVCSAPKHHTSDVSGMDLTLGPKPNATDVPLGTTITVRLIFRGVRRLTSGS